MLSKDHSIGKVPQLREAWPGALPALVMESLSFIFNLISYGVYRDVVSRIALASLYIFIIRSL